MKLSNTVTLGSFLALAVVATGTMSVTDAAVISVNFAKNSHGLSSSQTAGLVPEDNWNNYENSGAPISLSNVVLKDGGGVATSATLSVFGTGNPFNNQTETDPDQRMMNGLVSGGTYTVSGLSSSFTGQGYDVIIYVAHDSRVGSVLQTNLTPTGGSTITLYGKQASPAFVDATSPIYIDATQTTKIAAFASNGGYYIRYQNLTASGFSFSGQYWTSTAAVTSSAFAGFQIVSIVPEPASLAMLGLCGLLMLPRRRRA